MHKPRKAASQELPPFPEPDLRPGPNPSAKQHRKPTTKRGEYSTMQRVRVRRAIQELGANRVPETFPEFYQAIAKQLGKDCPSPRMVRSEFARLAKFDRQN
jgi:hypothetical protein